MAASGPQLDSHKGVVIRYGYDIVSDLYYAHFTLLPKQPGQPGFQAVIGTGMAAVAQTNPSPVTAASADEVLRLARQSIDQYIG